VRAPMTSEGDGIMNRGNGRPVVLALAVLSLAVLAGCVGGNGSREAAVAPDTTLAARDSAGVAAAPVSIVPPAPPTDTGATPPAASAFIAFVESQRAPDSAGVARGYAAEGLRLLVAGIEALAVQDSTQDATRDSAGTAAIRPRLLVLRLRADSMQQAAEPLTRARLGSESFVIAGELLQTLQDRLARAALTDRAAEARQAAAAVRPDQALAAQVNAVRRFFERSAAAMRGLIGARTA